jgi:urease accessory protein
MLRLDHIVGSASDPALGEALHRLEHEGAVEHIDLAPEDTSRRRLHVHTDKGSECAIVLARDERLTDGTILMLESDRAIVVRFKEQVWLGLAPRDTEAAIELGYLAGNMHWSVRFDGVKLWIAQRGPAADYLARLDALLSAGRVERIGHG